jgi:hypothetical protein
LELEEPTRGQQRKLYEILTNAMPDIGFFFVARLKNRSDIEVSNLRRCIEAMGEAVDEINGSQTIATAAVINDRRKGPPWPSRWKSSPPTAAPR